jgi:hypothetical protein
MSDGILEFAELWRTNQQNERGQGGERGEGTGRRRKVSAGFSAAIYKSRIGFVVSL